MYSVHDSITGNHFGDFTWLDHAKSYADNFARVLGHPFIVTGVVHTADPTLAGDAPSA